MCFKKCQHWHVYRDEITGGLDVFLFMLSVQRQSKIWSYMYICFRVEHFRYTSRMLLRSESAGWHCVTQHRAVCHGTDSPVISRVISKVNSVCWETTRSHNSVCITIHGAPFTYMGVTWPRSAAHQYLHNFLVNGFLPGHELLSASWAYAHVSDRLVSESNMGSLSKEWFSCFFNYPSSCDPTYSFRVAPHPPTPTTISTPRRCFRAS